MKENRASGGSEKDIIYLTSRADLFQSQLKGKDINSIKQSELRNDISTDHIITVKDLLTDDLSLLGERLLCGLEKEYEVKVGSIKSAGKKVLVAGERFGKGSSREQAVWSLIESGIHIVIAPSFGPVFQNNADMLGLLTSTDLDICQKIKSGEILQIDEFLKGRDGMTKDIIRCGGLFKYLKKVNSNEIEIPELANNGERKPLNVFEKRVANVLNVKGVTVGDSCLLPIDEAYSYVCLSGLACQAMLREYGYVKTKIPVKNIRLYEDHFAHSSLPEIPELTKNQRQFGEELRLPPENYYKGKRSDGGGKGICHRERIENLNPTITHVAIATDSHTPTIGALPILAIPVGSSTFAAGISEGIIPFSVSPVVRVNLSGKLPAGVSLRDAQLEIASNIQDNCAGKVIEFGGEGLNTLSFDQVVSLCNMVPEVFNAGIAITEAYDSGVNYLMSRWGIDRENAVEMYSKPDPGCEYAGNIDFNLSNTIPTVATPGNPNNGISLKELNDHPHINKVIFASCTLGLEDLKEAAAVLKDKRINPGTRMIVTPSSDNIRKQAEDLGIMDILRNSGAEVVNESACGACIGQGLGSLEDGDLAITVTNRNFKGRMGSETAKAYMGGAIVAALTALTGHIVTIEEYMAEKDRIVANLADTYKQ